MTESQPEWIAQVRDVLETLNQGVIIADECPRVVYTNAVFRDMVGRSDDELVGRYVQDLFPPESHHDSMSYLQPIRSAYEESSYEGMRTAIFPSYFHGKCQRNGVDPPGCPNPDCPVVCGTPGSLVHFFPKLRFIVFNYVRNTLQQLCSPGNEAYEKSEHAVVQAAARHRRREGRQVPWFEYAVIGAGGELARSLELDKNHSYVRRREENVKKEFERIVRQVPILLEEACGGRASEDENALPKCSWEDRMKSYTLTFP